MPWYPYISNDDYHNDDELIDYYSSSNIRDIINHSPAHMRYNKLNRVPPTPAMVFGEIFHTAVLEPDKLIVAPDVNKRTKAGRAELQEFKEANADKIICTPEELTTAQAMAKAVMNHRFAAALLDAPGSVEQTGTFQEPTFGIKGKIRVDKLNQDDGIMVDLKTTTNAGEEAFSSKAIFNYGYDIQGCWYNLGGMQIDRKSYEFIIIAVEKTPPFGVNTFRLTERHFELAYRKVDGILDTLSKCIDNDNWPSYPQRIINPDIPAWEFKKYHG